MQVVTVNHNNGLICAVPYLSEKTICQIGIQAYNEKEVTYSAAEFIGLPGHCRSCAKRLFGADKYIHLNFEAAPTLQWFALERGTHFRLKHLFMVHESYTKRDELCIHNDNCMRGLTIDWLDEMYAKGLITETPFDWVDDDKLTSRLCPPSEKALKVVSETDTCRTCYAYQRHAAIRTKADLYRVAFRFKYGPGFDVEPLVQAHLGRKGGVTMAKNSDKKFLVVEGGCVGAQDADTIQNAKEIAESMAEKTSEKILVYKLIATVKREAPPVIWKKVRPQC
jgi:hypothetical protein